MKTLTNYVLYLIQTVMKILVFIVAFIGYLIGICCRAADNTRKRM